MAFNQTQLYYPDELLIGPLHNVFLGNILSKLNSAINRRDARDIYSLFYKAEQHCNYLGIGFQPDLNDIKEASELIKIKNGELIYSPSTPTLLVPQLIIPVHINLISLIKENPNYIFSIKPREFEEIIAELFRARGYIVELTQATRDGGRDIIAIHEDFHIRSKYLIECKRYSLDKKVTVSVVRQLYGVKFHETVNKAILATTSAFTKDAREFASKHIWDLDLKAHDDIIQWIQEYRTK